MVKECVNGQMEKNILECGDKGNSMERESFGMERVRVKKENGITE